MDGDAGIVAGLVPERCRAISCCDIDGLGLIAGGVGVVLSCAAEADGRNRRRGATEPTAINGCLRSSGVGATPLADWLSVDAVVPLPLRWRSLYFSIASASRSRMRVAIGDKADAGLPDGGMRWDCPEGEAVENEPLPDELADGWAGE